MKKKIIGLYAARDRGKTSVLKKVILHFKPDEVMEYDHRTVIDIDGIKVGISTGGDDAQTIQETIKLFDECHIIVTATHVKDETVVEVNKYCDDSDIIWIKKAELSDQLNSQGFEAINSIEAVYLVDFIKQLVGKFEK